MRRSDPAPTRQVVTAAMALVVLGAIGALQAGLAGADFMFDLEQVQPALARTPPVTADPQTPRLARRVFLVIVDGLRLDKSYELPFFDELRRRGVDLEATSHYPTWSRPNYVSILTGVPPSASGVRTNHHNTPVLLDSLMDRAHGAGLRVAMATDYDVLPRMFLRPRGHRASEILRKQPIAEDLAEGDDAEGAMDVDAMDQPMSPAAVRAPDADLVSPFDDARYAPWPGGFTEAGAALAGRDADLVVLLVGAVDAAGHTSGGDSPEYRDAALIADRAVARVLGRVDLTQDAIVVTADHGHTGRGGHGGMEAEVLSVPLILAGAGVKPGASAALAAQLIDVAPTVAALLAMPAPGHGLGRTLVELLTLDDAARVKRRAADDVRLAVTRGVVAAASGRADADVLDHRARRIGLVAGGALLATGLALVALRRRVMRLDVRVLLVTMPAFFVVYYGLIGTLGQRFSPSLLPANGHMAGQLAKYGIAAMVVQIISGMWILRGKANFGERLAAANGIAWLGLMLSIIPAGLLWAFFPPPYVSVPGPILLVMIPGVQVSVAAAAAGVALTLAIEVIVFAARAWHAKSVP